MMVCCEAVPQCPGAQCWAGFDCFKETMCCSTIDCQGPAPIILIVVLALTAFAAVPIVYYFRRRRRALPARKAERNMEAQMT